jgi:uncharacterized membrane protein
MLKVDFFFPVFEKNFERVTMLIQMITYVIATLIVISGIFYSIFYYFKEYSYSVKGFYDLRTILGETVSASLSFILCGQILKLFTIREYKQLVIVVSLALLKIILSYSVSYEIANAPDEILKRVTDQKKVNKLLNLQTKS